MTLSLFQVNTNCSVNYQTWNESFSRNTNLCVWFMFASNVLLSLTGNPTKVLHSVCVAILTFQEDLTNVKDLIIHSHGYFPQGN